MRTQLPFSSINSVRRPLTWLLILFIGLPWLAQAQCPTGDQFGNVSLESQDQVDHFPASCTNVLGTLTVSGADITNLNGLRNLQSIDINLSIRNNPQLTSLAGLTSLTSVGASVQINNDALLASLNGLNRLQSVRGDLQLQTNPQLTSLAGLTSLTSVGASMVINTDVHLTNMDGLNKLQSVGGSLILVNNPQLTNLTALTALTSVGADLRIFNNALLASLDGLNNLQSVGNLRIQNNPTLSVCALDAICLLLATTPANNGSIAGNAAGCSSVAEVQDRCANRIVITAQPPSQSAVCAGSTVTVAVSTTGNVQAYQWYKGNQPVGGQTTNTLSLSNVQPADAGTYQVVVSNSVSSLTSTAFNLTVTPQSPDYQPLVDLYISTGGPTWINKANWLTGCTPCNWYGVTCDGNGRVISLDLTKNGLKGSIPASLSNLTSLQSLQLPNNQLSGPIPASLGNLTNLGFLGLGFNQLTGTIPPELSNLTRLILLALDDNKLEGTISASLSVLTNLQSIYLYNNQLSGPIPEGLGNLTKLQYLYLQGNQLSGSIPTSIGNLTNLQVLYLNDNRLSGIIPAGIGNLTNLREIGLQNNQVSGNLPATLSNLNNLELLNVGQNQLNGPILGSLSKLTKLRIAYFNNNQLSGCFPASLSALCGKLYFGGNPNLPGGGDFGAFCASGAGSDTFRPLATASPNPVCAASPVSLSVSAGTFYQWSGPAGFAATTQTPTFTPATAASSGVYSVTVGNGSLTCTATAIVVLTVNPLADAGFTGLPASVCVDAGPSTLTPTTPGGSFAGPGISGNTFSPATAGAGGPYSITYTVSGQGCANTSVQTVTVKPTPPAPAITTQSGQSGQLYPGGQSAVTVPQYSGIVTLLISGCTGTIKWQGPNGSSGSTTSIPVATSATGTFVYQATCQQNGCSSAVGSATVVVQSAPLTVVAPLFDCATGKLTLRTTGGNGQPIEYQVPSVTNGWQATNPESIEPKDFKKSLKLRARQRASDNKGYDSAELDYQLPICPGARLGVSEEPVAGLRVTVLGNPVTGQSVSVEVRGAEGQPLQLTLTNLQGQPVSERSIEQAGAIETQTLPMSNQPAGVLLLRVSTPNQRQTVKVLKAN